MKELIGQMLGNFRVESVLGEGGMGAVLKAPGHHLTAVSSD